MIKVKLAGQGIHHIADPVALQAAAEGPHIQPAA